MVWHLKRFHETVERLKETGVYTDEDFDNLRIDAKRLFVPAVADCIAALTKVAQNRE